EHGAARDERDVLVEPCRLQPRRAPDLPGVGGQLAVQDFQERGLAGAVASDDRNPLALVDLQRRVIEQRKVTERGGDVRKRDEGHQIRVLQVRWGRWVRWVR